MGHFLLPGSRTIPFVFKVQKISNGRSYCVRDVSVTVQGQSAPCFTASCAFKKAEDNVLDIQEHVDLWEKFSPALKGKRPSDFEEVPGMDVPWVSIPQRSILPFHPSTG